MLLKPTKVAVKGVAPLTQLAGYYVEVMVTIRNTEFSM